MYYDYVSYAMDVCDACKKLTGRKYSYKINKSQVHIEWFENGKKLEYIFDCDLFLSIHIKPKECAKMICED